MAAVAQDQGYRFATCRPGRETPNSKNTHTHSLSVAHTFQSASSFASIQGTPKSSQSGATVRFGAKSNSAKMELPTLLRGDNIPPARAAVAVDRLPGTAGAKPQLDGINLLESLKAEPWYVGQAVHVAQVGSRAANFAYPNAELHPLLKEVLRGVLQDAASDGLKLYSHQAEAIDAIMIQNKDVVISTSTGSGKSLVYVVAIFEALLREENATAFLIFPTKALAQDSPRRRLHMCLHHFLL